MSKLVALIGGGDWTDASVNHVVIPDDMDLKKQEEEWWKWYKKFRSSRRDEYISFGQWLINNGAREATEDDVIEYGEP